MQLLKGVPMMQKRGIMHMAFRCQNSLAHSTSLPLQCSAYVAWHDFHGYVHVTSIGKVCAVTVPWNRHRRHPIVLLGLWMARLHLAFT